jgi:hypothetical protein
VEARLRAAIREVGRSGGSGKDVCIVVDVLCNVFDRASIGIGRQGRKSVDSTEYRGCNYRMLALVDEDDGPNDELSQHGERKGGRGGVMADGGTDWRLE